MNSLSNNSKAYQGFFDLGAKNTSFLYNLILPLQISSNSDTP